MIFQKNNALIASLGALALMLVASEASARAVITGTRGGMTTAPSHKASTAPHSNGQRSSVHASRHRHHDNGVFGFGLPGYYGYDGAYGQAPADAAPSGSNDVHYTYTYDVPWDWAHRLPPQVAPSDRPYVPGCSSEGVSVPGSDGRKHSVNITRCY